MPFDASKVFQRIYNWIDDRDNSVPIMAERVNADTEDIVQGINEIVDGTVGFTGTIKATNGTASQPSYTFGDDTDIGIYRIANDKIGMATGGLVRFELDAQKLNLKQDLVIEETFPRLELKNTGVSTPNPSGNISSPMRAGNEYHDDYIGFVKVSPVAQNGDVAIVMKEGEDGQPYWYVEDDDIVPKFYKIWNEKNDGDGSGLDADTVKGYTPVNKAGDAFTGLVQFSRDSDFQIQVGAGVNRNPRLEFYNLSTLRGKIQSISDRMRISSGSHHLDLKTDGGGFWAGNEILTTGNLADHGVQSTDYAIAADAFVEVTTPRNSGMCEVLINPSYDYPSPQKSAIFYYDVGVSPYFVELEFGVFGETAHFTTTDVSDVTTLTDGKLHVIIKSGKLKIVNRFSGSATFRVTM